jgi:hypothetical protein
MRAIITNTDTGNKQLYIVKDNIAQAIAVEILATDGDSAAVSGVNTGDLIVIRGGEFIDDGDTVQLSNTLP